VQRADEAWEYVVAHHQGEADTWEDFDGPDALSSEDTRRSTPIRLPPGDSFLTACDELVAFARSILTDHRPGASAEMLELAERAAAASEARKDEDIASWAERVARDVANADD